MAYCVSELQYAQFPSDGAVGRVLKTLGLPMGELLRAFHSYVCPVMPQGRRGYQMDIADNLAQYLEAGLRRDGLRPTRSRYELTYSPHLKQHADVGLIHVASNQRVLFEIEFRPNYEKDLVKFQIGATCGRLAAAVMVVAIDRKNVNASYTTMPEYAAIVRVVSELRPAYPLLVIGIRGTHIAK